MNLNLYPKPEDVPAGVWRRTLVALHERAYRHAEGRSHTRLTELLPSRTVGYTLRHLYRYPFCCTSEQKYIDEALRRYEFLLDKSEMRERQRLGKLPERCMADMPIEWNPEFHLTASPLQQDPTFEAATTNALSEADLIAGLCQAGVSEYIAYLWLWLRWYKYSYEETAFHLKNRFGEDKTPDALRKMANRYFRKNLTLMGHFYILLTGEPPTPEMWNRIKAPMKTPRKISSKTTHTKKRPQRPERCGRFSYPFFHWCGYQPYYRCSPRRSKMKTPSGSKYPIIVWYGPHRVSAVGSPSLPPRSGAVSNWEPDVVAQCPGSSRNAHAIPPTACPQSRSGWAD